jgi:hypothetical protein
MLAVGTEGLDETLHFLHWRFDCTHLVVPDKWHLQVYLNYWAAQTAAATILIC